MKPLYVKKNGTVNKVSGVAMPNTYPADRVGYDNTASELEATNTQDAIDEVVDIVTDKVDKVASPTAGNLAGLNASGNLTDAGWSADKTTTSATGNPISISGLKINQLAINPIITLEPIQAGSGDPSPSNIRAISGYDKIEVLSCGKNLFDKSKAIDGKRMTSDGSIIDGAAYSVSDYIPVKPNTVYYLSHVMGLSVFYTSGTYTKDKTFIELKSISGDDNTSGSITTSANAAYIRVNMLLDNKNSVQIEENNQATTYVPYHKTTDLSLQLGSTIYGGTLDVEKGILTVDKKRVDLGSLTWFYYNNFYTILGDRAVESQGQKTVLKCCSIYNIETSEYSTGHDNSDNVIYTVPGDSMEIYCRNTSYGTDTSAFKTAMSGQYLVYRIKEPYIIQLTPHEISLLKDYAYVSTNGTNMSFSYKNGEMASLADVAQLGQTVNELGNVVSEIFSHKVALTDNFVAPGNGFASVYVLQGQGTSSGTNINVTEDGVTMFSHSIWWNWGWAGTTILVPLRKGHTYTFACDTSPAYILFDDNKSYFIY